MESRHWIGNEAEYGVASLSFPARWFLRETIMWIHYDQMRLLSEEAGASSVDVRVVEHLEEPECKKREINNQPVSFITTSK